MARTPPFREVRDEFRGFFQFPQSICEILRADADLISLWERTHNFHQCSKGSGTPKDSEGNPTLGIRALAMAGCGLCKLQIFQWLSGIWLVENRMQAVQCVWRLGPWKHEFVFIERHVKYVIFTVRRVSGCRVVDRKKRVALGAREWGLHSSMKIASAHARVCGRASSCPRYKWGTPAHHASGPPGQRCSGHCVVFLWKVMKLNSDFPSWGFLTSGLMLCAWLVFSWNKVNVCRHQHLGESSCGGRGQGGGALLCSAFAASLSCCKAKSSYWNSRNFSSRSSSSAALRAAQRALWTRPSSS